MLTGEATFDPPTSALDENGQGKPYAVFGFGAHLAEIAVDTELGTVRVLKIIAAHDVGRAINPTLIEGQIEGGAAQGLGMALMEEFFPGKGENLHDYLIPSAGDMPPVESILIEDPSSVGPFGAKGIGEQAVIPTAPAILNAIHDAIGVRIRRLPATPDRIRAAILAPAPRRPDERAGCPPDSRRDAGATPSHENNHDRGVSKHRVLPEHKPIVALLRTMMREYAPGARENKLRHTDVEAEARAGRSQPYQKRPYFRLFSWCEI